MPSVIAETEAALSERKSVVISLVGTGEARTKEQVAKATANGGMLELCGVPGYVASNRQLLTNQALGLSGRHISEATIARAGTSLTLYPPSNV